MYRITTNKIVVLLLCMNIMGPIIGSVVPNASMDTDLDIAKITSQTRFTTKSSTSQF